MGMGCVLVEVDAYADASLEPASDESSEGIQIRQGQDLTYVAATAVRATAYAVSLGGTGQRIIVGCGHRVYICRFVHAER